MLRPTLSSRVELPFHPVVAGWFTRRFRAPTEPQRLGWAEIAQERNTLIAAPTGSGKTLAAFLASIDRLVSLGARGELPDSVQVVYVSPLKALSNDIHRNLEVPLAEIRQFAHECGTSLPLIRTAVRTGDTPSADRQAMLRRPPHILVTTPESLFLLVTSVRGREMLGSVHTLIVDEIHALARDKRGSHLALTLERLDLLCRQRPVRVGLSATQRPMEEIAQFLVGSPASAEPARANCSIIDVGHLRELDLAVQVPPSELSAVCSHEQWEEIYEELSRQIDAHRSTLVFVNTRRMAERVAHRLIQTLGEEAVASHHGSLSREIRLSAEERLKSGKLRAIVATASLEMGIDVGYIDLVCQLGSPRSIATFLQRVGRSGHALGRTPKGRLYPLTRDELVECLALVRSVRQGRLDRVEIPLAPLDVLAQQIVAMTACEEWDEQQLYLAVRRAYPYRDLPREDYEAVLNVLSEGISAAGKHGAYLHRDQLGGKLRARRGARIAALTSGGTIPETGDYRVVTEGERTFVGTLNEDFAIESLAGDVFLLGNNSWRICYVRGGEVTVVDAQGAPATVPFWLGEGLGRTAELSAAVSELREAIAQRIAWSTAQHATEQVDDSLNARADFSRAVAWLESECSAPPWAAEQATRYIAAQGAAIGLLPTQSSIVFERFFDESGGMQLVIHAPFGARVNRAWGLALRKRFCRSFDFELQAAADDNAVLLSIGPQHSFPIDALFRMLNPHNAEHLLVQALLAAPMFQTRWRWNVTRALAVLRQRGGKKVPPYLQRFRSDDLLAAVFPETVGCLENHSGDVEIPDHPLVRQTLDDCLHEAMDLDRWLDVLRAFQAGEVQFVARETREPSPFAHEILNANPYSFLDDAPLEERRVRAVSTRRTLSIESMRDLGRLDPAAIEAVVAETWPTVRDADELHDVLMTVGALPAQQGESWRTWFEPLQRAGRAFVLPVGDSVALWSAAERWPLLRAIYPHAAPSIRPQLPPALDVAWERSPALAALVRGRVQISGPTTAGHLGRALGLEESAVRAALEALEGEGVVMRGSFTSRATTDEVEWCDRRLLARIHRLTLDGLRRQIQPVAPHDYLRFLAVQQRVVGVGYQGVAGLRSAIEQLQGFEMAAGSWEARALPLRVRDYEPELLDQLSLSGQLVWGRMNPPRRDADQQPSTAGLTRAGAIALALREDLAWLLPPERSDECVPLRGNAQVVLETLQARGALFYHELRAATNLLEAHLDDALQELTAVGLVTADTFGAVRWIAERRRGRGRRRRTSRHGLRSSPATSGRWSLFPGAVNRPGRDEYLRRWANQLLKRWGVVFRDLLVRESIAPPWSELVPVLRRMEARGDVRGGRFVGGVAGEQYGLPGAVDQLRRVREQPPSAEWFVVSANDPLNLSGVLSDEPRVAAVHTSSVAIRDGRLLASRQTSGITFEQQVESDLAAEISRQLRRTERLPR